MTRMTQFLLHHVNTDIIAMNLSEATARIYLAETLVSEKSVSIEVYPAINHQEILNSKISFT